MSDTEFSPAGEKLQKVLARIGLASRRDLEAWISEGRVKVNGVVATLGQRVDSHDAISVDGRLIAREEVAAKVRRVLIYNKPDGEICTRDDPEGRPTVFDRLPKAKEGRWINIGRLDINTTGLLMFTTDGELANRLMHPSYQMDREYAVRVRGEVTEEMIELLKTGVMLEDGPAKFTDIKEAPGGEGFNHWYHCVVMEGRNREVRRLWESQGLVVSRLKRVRFGPVFLTSDLTMGRWREMSQYEVDILAAEVGLKPVALPTMKGKEREKIERQQRKLVKPVGRAARGERSTTEARAERPARPKREDSAARPARSRPAEGGRSGSEERPARPGKPAAREAGRSAPAGRPARVLRPPLDEAGSPSERPARPPRREDDRPAKSRKPAERSSGSKPGSSSGPKRSPKGSEVADRPRDQNKKRPAPKRDESATSDSARPARKPAAAPAKRRSIPASEGQRPGFGRKR